MYAALRATDAYRQTEVRSRTPLELVVMLYDGALQFMSVADEAIRRRDIAGRKTAISKALAIISELQSTLNMDQGGEIAASLDELYRWSSVRLLDATAQNDTAPLEEVIGVFRTLRDGWSGIASGSGGQ
ncbi:MAG: flagellar export chaperone FliS [Vicinamibacterales bacterium]